MRKIALTAAAAIALLGTAACTGPDKSNMPDSEPAAAPAQVVEENAAPVAAANATTPADNATAPADNATNATAAENATGG